MKVNKYKIEYFIFIVFSIIIGICYILLPIVLAITPFFLLTLPCLPGLYGGMLILNALIPRKNKKRYFLDASNDVLLENLIGEIAQSIGVRRPDIIRLTIDCNASAKIENDKSVISLGLPLIFILREQELRALVAHELAHHFQGDTVAILDHARIRISVMSIIEKLNKSKSVFIVWPFKKYARFYLRRIMHISRKAEYSADLCAANLVGIDSCINALYSVIKMDDISKEFIHIWVERLKNADISPKYLAIYKYFCQNYRGSKERLLTQSEFTKDYSDMLDSHPTLYERIKNVIDNTTYNSYLEERYMDFEIKDYEEDFNTVYFNSGNDQSDSDDEIIDYVIKYYLFIHKKYRIIFVDYTFNQLIDFLVVLGPITYKLYEITKNDNSNLELFLVHEAIIAALINQSKKLGWHIIPQHTFIPIIVNVSNKKSYNLNNVQIILKNRNETEWLELIRDLDLYNKKICNSNN